MSPPEHCQDKLDFTGIGVGGSGGHAAGRVKSILLEDVGHLIAMEAVDESADLAAEWIGSEMRRWRAEEEALAAEWRKKSKIEKVTIDEEWRRHVGPPSRPAATKL
jgi:hypothetical protein